jgi:hypothetical protein
MVSGVRLEWVIDRIRNLINYLLKRAATTHLSKFAKGFI